MIRRLSPTCIPACGPLRNRPLRPRGWWAGRLRRPAGAPSSSCLQRVCGGVRRFVTALAWFGGGWVVVWRWLRC